MCYVYIYGCVTLLTFHTKLQLENSMCTWHQAVPKRPFPDPSPVQTSQALCCPSHPEYHGCRGMRT